MSKTLEKAENKAFIDKLEKNIDPRVSSDYKTFILELEKRKKAGQEFKNLEDNYLYMGYQIGRKMAFSTVLKSIELEKLQSCIGEYKKNNTCKIGGYSTDYLVKDDSFISLIKNKLYPNMKYNQDTEDEINAKIKGFVIGVYEGIKSAKVKGSEIAGNLCKLKTQNLLEKCAGQKFDKLQKQTSQGVQIVNANAIPKINEGNYIPKSKQYKPPTSWL